MCRNISIRFSALRQILPLFLAICFLLIGCTPSAVPSGSPTPSGQIESPTPSESQPPEQFKLHNIDVETASSIADFTFKQVELQYTSYTLPREELVLPLLSEESLAILDGVSIGTVCYADGIIYYSLSCFIDMYQYPTLGVFVAMYDIETEEASIIYTLPPASYVYSMTYCNGYIYWSRDNRDDGPSDIHMYYDPATGEVYNLPIADPDITFPAYQNIDIHSQYVVMYEHINDDHFAYKLYSTVTQEVSVFTKEELGLSKFYRSPFVYKDMALFQLSGKTPASDEDEDEYEPVRLRLYDLIAKETLAEIEFPSSYAYGYIYSDSLIAWSNYFGYHEVYAYDLNTEKCYALSYEGGYTLRIYNGLLYVYNSSTLRVIDINTKTVYEAALPRDVYTDFSSIDYQVSCDKDGIFYLFDLDGMIGN